MRALVQRVTTASVDIDDSSVASIGSGLCILVGITHYDDSESVDRLADKVLNLRIFDDDDGRMNLSVQDTNKEVLVVSQFTLYGDSSRGRRPSWSAAAGPDIAEPLINQLVARIHASGVRIETGIFGAYMRVSLTNDGPLTLLLEV